MKRVDILAPFNKNDPELQINLSSLQRTSGRSRLGLKGEMLRLTIGLPPGTRN